MSDNPYGLNIKEYVPYNGKPLYFLEEKDFHSEPVLEWKIDEHGSTIGSCGRFKNWVYIFRNAENDTFFVWWPDISIGDKAMIRYLPECVTIEDAKAWCQKSWERNLEIIMKRLDEAEEDFQG